MRTPEKDLESIHTRVGADDLGDTREVVAGVHGQRNPLAIALSERRATGTSHRRRFWRGGSGRLYPLIFLTLVACSPCGSEPTAADAPLAPPAPDDMVLVTAGKFLMGDPPREVELDAFLIDRTEVTQGEYDKCVAAGVCTAAFFIEVVMELPPPNHPVVNVSSDDATTYCAWLGKQLPTEAQWEKAARGVDGRTYPWGEDPPTCDRAMLTRWTLVSPQSGRVDACGGAINRYDPTHPVGLHPNGASPYGALDMAGNVLEWTADVEGPYLQVVRSGRMLGGSDDQARADYRKLVSNDPRFRRVRDPLIGFRCVRVRKGQELPYPESKRGRT